MLLESILSHSSLGPGVSQRLHAKASGTRSDGELGGTAGVLLLVWGQGTSAHQTPPVGQELRQAHCPTSLVETPQQHSAVGIISPMLQMRKLQLREVEQHAKGHTAKKW